MNGFKQLIHELHRRSVWQVLGIFLAGSWGVIQVVDVLTERVGLPDWTPTMAVVLLLIGLPIVLATAFVQEGMPGADPMSTPDTNDGSAAPETAAPAAPAIPRSSANRPFLTWRNVILGGVGAFALLGFALIAYFVMWTSGIGPVGNLVAQGVLDERDPVVLATFSDATGEGLGDVVTEALRVDLLESPVLSIVPAGRLGQVLRLMERPENEPLTAELAREVAQRAGFKAIIQGDVAAAGSAYVISAAVVAAESGDELKAFRVTARSEDDLVDAIDQLSQDIREGAGESLRNIRAGQPLERATTSSFAALRDLTEAERAEERGEYDEALRLLSDAVARDSAFSMAYRKIAVLYYNLGASPDSARRATLLAYRHRDRLSERERYLTEAYYHSQITGDATAREAAYRNVLRVAPDDGAALNNLALALQGRGEIEEAIELLERAVGGPGLTSVSMANLAMYRFRDGDIDGGTDALEAYEASFPDHLLVPWARASAANARGDTQTLHAHAEEMSQSPTNALRDRTASLVGFRDASRGSWLEAEGHFAEAARIDTEDGRPFALMAVRLSALLAGGRVTRDASYGAGSLPALSEAFEATTPVERPWADMIVLLATVGDVEEAQSVYDAWPEELYATTRIGLRPGGRAHARAHLLVARGDLEGAAAALESARRESACRVCYRQSLADVYRRLGRTDEAIALLEPERLERFHPSAWPLEQVLATRDIAPLYEAVGDTTAAVDAYRAFAEAWNDADPELQPQVRHARERIAELGG